MQDQSSEFIYGINPAYEVVRAGRRQVYDACLVQGKNLNPRIKKLAGFLEKKGVRVHWVEKGRLYDKCRSQEHQGVVLEVSPYPYVKPEQIWTHHRILLMDNVEDPQNVGAILRSAEVFGFRAILLPTKGAPEVYASVVKASAGASEHLQIMRSGSANSYVKEAKTRNYRVIALDASGKASLDEEQKNTDSALMLVVGGEDQGVGQYILMESDAVVSIPQQGQINSLNASVAAGIALHALAVAH